MNSCTVCVTDSHSDCMYEIALCQQLDPPPIPHINTHLNGHTLPHSSNKLDIACVCFSHTVLPSLVSVSNTIRELHVTITSFKV